MTTQIVILAAGMGSRLGRSLPKPLTQLSDGRSIMRQQHDNIRAAFGSDARVTTVVGYRAESIVEAFPEADYVYNDSYDQTNTSKSLLRGLGKTGRSGVLWMNGDVVFDPRVLGRAVTLIEADRSFVTVNTSKVSDEEVKYTVAADGHTYERKPAEQYLSKFGTSPRTGAKLAHKSVLPNLMARELCACALQLEL